MTHTVTEEATDREVPLSHAGADEMLSKTVEAFCAAMKEKIGLPKEEGGFARCTATNYVAAARIFARGFPPDARIGELEPASVRKWFTGYKKGRHPNTIIQTGTRLHVFFRWCVSEGYLADDLSKELILPRRVRPRSEELTEEQMRALLKATTTILSPFRRYRACALFHMLYFGGFRRQEVLDLKLGDLFFSDRGRVEIRHGKGDKPRTVFVRPECVRVVQEWLSVRPESAPHDYLFCTDRTRRLSTRALTTIQRDIYSRADVPYPLRPLHSVRHTYASDMLEKGVDLKTISELMGHSDTRTTELYLHSTMDKMQRASMLVGVSPLPPALPQKRVAASVEERRRRIPTRRLT